ncbi:MAG TPA: efflux RND transporter periplasmic adaptor subunit [Candidatus Methylacidiphilales bacterium]|nr:efflux RND transporter periplasmic adaptor subunit [Candidatus Methylacidiphilales bacterium]
MKSAEVTPPAPPVAQPAQAPFPNFVAGAGLVEANSENIAIGTQIAGIVSKIYVQIGSRVKAGDPLFTIDDRATRATLAVQQAAVQVAQAQLATAQHDFERASTVPATGAVSVEEVDQRRYTVQIAEAQLAQAQAQVNATQTDLDRLTVRAPVDGQVLQLKVHLGEYAPTGVLDQPLILFGAVTPLNVRTDVDENDAWRVRPNAPAVGYLMGNKNIGSPLKFVRFEPYVIPKASLTGVPTERVDTRVLQVIYSIQRNDLPIFAGQQMDVYIDTNPNDIRATQLLTP